MPRPTARLRFRQMTASDLDDRAAHLGDPDVMRFYPVPKTRDETSEWIRWNQRNSVEHGYGLRVIETLYGDFVGDCGLTWRQVNAIRMLDVGYHVRPELHGLGYATKAAVACRDFARQHTNTAELVAIMQPDNRASKRVAEKIGMHRVEDDHGGSIPVRTVLSMQL